MNNSTLRIATVVILIGAGVFMWTSGAVNKDGASTLNNQAPIVTSGENAPEGSIHNLAAEPAAVAAKKDLSTILGVTEGSIVIMKVEEATWTDGCLGLGGPAESCLQALVEGFRVELLASGKTYIYRTDGTGMSLRQETDIL